VAGKKISANLFAIDGLIEKPTLDKAPSNLAIVGRYIFPAEIFPALERTKPDQRGEIQLTDAIALLKESVPIYGYCFSGKRYDIGSHLSYLTTNVELALKRPELKDKLKKFLKEILASDGDN
jgi:UTP--glucose-1-phosphate uridylyltransferase